MTPQDLEPSEEVRTLARLVSPAVRVEPDRLRAVRLAFLPRSGSWLEASLWFSPLVQARNADGLVLRPDVIAMLRGELVGHAKLDALRQLQEPFRKALPPLLAIEEEIVWLALSGAADAANGHLLSVLKTMLLSPERAPALATWAVRALGELPATVQSMPAAMYLDIAASSRSRRPLRLAEFYGGDHPLALVLPDLLPPDFPDVDVAIERRGDRLVLEALREPRPGVTILRAPLTDPVVLVVIVGDTSEVAKLHIGIPCVVRAPGDAITVRTLRGDEWELTRRLGGLAASESGTGVSPRDQRRADVVILTAIKLEFDAVLKVEAGAVAGSSWEEAAGPSGVPMLYRRFNGEGTRPLRVAVAMAPDMGAVAAVNTLLPLIEALKPRCIAMCGVCAGRRGKVLLGDVIAADRSYYYDTGKHLSGRFVQDLTTYALRDDWKVALEGMDPIARFRGERWFHERPLTTEWRLCRALIALRDEVPEPWAAVDPAPGGADEWPLIVAALRDRKLLTASGLRLTKAGHRFVEDLLLQHHNALPDLSPTGKLHPFCLHVAPIGTGAQIIEDEQIWAFVSQAMRKTLGIEMEAAVIGEAAHRLRHRQLDWVVMKGVMDFADHGPDDHFEEYAARASAECLLWFLREHVATEPVAGFDDVLTPGTLALPAGAVAPSILLAAPFAVVPWHQARRDDVIAELDRWADDSARVVAVRLLHADGGVGKTRLAIEWLRRRRGEDGESKRRDIAGFLPPDPADDWLERLCGLSAPVVVAVDYAETRPDLVAVLARLAATARTSKPERRIRLLLLARSDGDWWEALRQRDLSINALLSEDAPIELTPLVTSTVERQIVFDEALNAFAARKQRPAPEVTIDPSDPRFERVLYLQMAALAAVERGTDLSGAAHGAVPRIVLKADALMDEVLDHEQRFWLRGRPAPSPDLESLAQELVAAATLRGGLSKPEAWKLCGRLMHQPHASAEDELLAQLHQIYPSSDPSKYLPGLQPDLLGEAMVLRVAAKHANAAWIERVIVPGDDTNAISTAFTVLDRAATTNTTLVHPWLDQLLRTDLPMRAVLALRVTKAAGLRTALSCLGDLLADALDRDGSRAVALALAEEGIPDRTVSLRRVAEWYSRVQLAQAPEGDEDQALAARAASLNDLGVRLSEVGQREAALDATREAVEAYRALAAKNADTVLPGLAMGLNNLGNLLSALGRREAALDATREAIEAYRTLAAKLPDSFLPDLAMSLNNFGGLLSEVGQREAALDITREAVELRRALAAKLPDSFLPDLAMSLNNLGVRFIAVGQREAALEAVREAVEAYRALATKHPDAFLPDLAASLNSLGNLLSAVGQRDAALDSTREAVDAYRALAVQLPESFLPDLAMGLSNLGVRLIAVGQREAALAATREAVEAYRALAAKLPDVFLPPLGGSLNNLGSHLSAVGQREAALAATREAVELRRTLATKRPDVFLPDLAGSLNNLGIRLSEVGEREAALDATREAVELHRALAAKSPDVFLPELAMSLNNLSTDSNAVGQREAALDATREAVATYRALAAKHPDAFLPDLALSLNNLGTNLNAIGQREAALDATREAVDVYRVLAAKHPDAFLPDFAASLNNLGVALSEVGEREAALNATREAVELRRALAAKHPDVLLPGLARSLNNLGLRLSEVGQREAALDATREAVELRRALAATHPDTFLPDLATSLNNFASLLSTADQREAALDATREAVESCRSLAAKHPDAFLPDLASSLANLGLRLSQIGQREAALDATREAVESYRTLAAKQPEMFLSDLAMSVANLGNRLSQIGQREAALDTTREAVESYRTLAAKDPDAFVPHLARSLTNLGNQLSDLGQREAALDATREAVQACRTLAAKHPDAFLPDLATSLTNLGIRLSQVGQREAALDVTREAVEAYRTLAAKHPDTFLPDLASSLNNLGADLSEVGEREAALDATREVVELRRALAAKHPDAFLPDLATSLNNLGNLLSEVGQREAALETTREAVELRRALATKHPDAFLPDLATSLNNLGTLLSEVGQSEAALDATREAIELRRALAVQHPDAFLPDLATSLNNLGSFLSEVGQREAALDATHEATTLRRALAAQHPDAFLPDLASSLNNLGAMLSEVGQREAALDATHEAVELRRALTTKHPDAFLPDLASSLNNLGILLSAIGRRETALDATHEAVEAYRALAAKHPDAFLPNLATSLNNLSNRLSEVGLREAALDATRQAVELRRALAAKDPGPFFPDLATSLDNLARRLTETGDHGAANAAFQEAAEIRRTLQAKPPRSDDKVGSA